MAARGNRATAWRTSAVAVLPGRGGDKATAGLLYSSGGGGKVKLLVAVSHGVAGDFRRASPDKVHGCDLHEGEYGHAGSIISWSYTHDGKHKIAKQLIQTINEEKKLIEFKTLEGDLMEEYKDFLVTLHVETKNNIDLVTWTMEYETLNEKVDHPISLLAFLVDLTKDIETHHAGN
ncbi:hypothetical protein CASFOL_030923 [Castilleja foliolosa]|uniref:Bet v I/Major latex protein domain-containing protein n=1 Tax=Castilleja foliolosa TaxID=1961234 RepID=A0ABD3C7C0_9LAMI